MERKHFEEEELGADFESEESEEGDANQSCSPKRN